MSITDHLRRGFLHLPPGVRRRVLHGLGRYAPWEAGFDFTPPPVEPGEETGPPDFVGIGVQKAGTTWWFELLLAHPEVSSHRAVHKERHFFDRFGARSMQPSDIVQYHGWFPRRTGTITGEWTPDYMAEPWVPPLLKRAAPDARLLVLLRDPVERFRSGLAHEERSGMPRDSRVIADAVQRGFYHRALGEWLAHFDAEQLLVLQFERCVAEPSTQLDRTLHHLGLDRTSNMVHEVARPPATDSRPLLEEDVRDQLVELYAADVAALAASVPDIDLTVWPNFAYLATRNDPPAVESPSTSNSPTRRT